VAKILLVDDDPAVRADLGSLLAREGHQVVTASDGADALGCLEREAVDLVISDLVMPHVDGLQLLQRLRQMAAPPPAIVISGGDRGMMECLDVAILFGARAALRKPVVWSELRGHIEALMD
jgi:CheY-like chemotaxis protein